MTTSATPTTPLRVTIWNENRHESDPESQAAKLYPTGMHGAIAAGLTGLLGSAIDVRTATLDEPEQGLPQSVLDSTDVLLWWGHEAHSEVSDELVDRIYDAVLGGMGIIPLHSAHYSKIFKKLMGTSCSLRWRNDGDREVMWIVDPTHPIAQGIPDPLIIEAQEMYGEFFDIPTPDELIFISSFSGGEVFRSGATWTRGHGRVFYFSPGDQEYPVYHQPSIHQVLANAVRWAAPTRRGPAIDATFHERGWFEAGSSSN
jgi:trehalose utilization protein